MDVREKIEKIYARIHGWYIGYAADFEHERG